MRPRLAFATAMLALALVPIGARAGVDPAGGLRLNDLQARGTHNSYHRNPRHPVGDQVGWNYSHRPLSQQLESQGVRQVELDVHYNMARDDFEVYHAWFGDDRSTCDLLRQCLAEIRAWSDAHPASHPVAVLIEPKDEGPPKNAGLPEDGDPFTMPFTDREYALLDEVLLASFGGPVSAGGRVLTPGDVTVEGRTLRESVLSDGWPLLSTVRQHVLFVLDGDSHSKTYSKDWSTLQGRAMFVQAEADEAVAAFVSRDGARLPGEGKYDRMRRLVRAGFMVRDYTDDFAAAKAGGAHFISTDHPDELQLSSEADVPTRCNPVSTEAAQCADADIERHAHVPGYAPPSDTESDEYDRVVTDKVDRLVVRSVESAVALITRSVP